MIYHASTIAWMAGDADYQVAVQGRLQAWAMLFRIKILDDVESTADMMMLFHAADKRTCRLAVRMSGGHTEGGEGVDIRATERREGDVPR